MKILIDAFKSMQDIPSVYTCDGKDISPKIEISEVPLETKSLLLIMDDPDSPSGDWLHWILWNIDPKITIIEEGSIPEGAIQGKNSWDIPEYGGPCPGEGKHRYVFTLYALDKELKASPDIPRAQIEEMILGHVLAKAQHIGLYQRITS